MSPARHGMTSDRIVRVVCLIALAVGCEQPSVAPVATTAADSQTSRSAAVERIDNVLTSAVSRQDVFGAVAIAVERDGVVYRGAFGAADESNGIAIDADAVFRIASMTKPVTSVAAMQLVEQGAIALDEPASNHLPELAQAQVLEQFDPQRGTYELRPPASPITLRHLLTHTAGFGYAFTSDTLRDFEPQADDGDVVGPLLFDPGTSWWYGTNTDWVGRLVESVSGQSLEAYFQEHIFEPLQMPDTAFNLPEADWSRTVALANRQGDGALVSEARQDPTPVTTFSGGGGLWSTANDYARFMRMWLNDGALDGQRVLSAQTVATMSVNHVGEVAAGKIVTALPDLSNDFRPTAEGRGRFGLGFLINLDDQPGRRAGGSLAWAGLYNTYFWIDPASGVAGAILTQVLPFADPSVLAVFDAFERAVYALVAEVV